MRESSNAKSHDQRQPCSPAHTTAAASPREPPQLPVTRATNVSTQRSYNTYPIHEMGQLRTPSCTIHSRAGGCGRPSPVASHSAPFSPHAPLRGCHPPLPSMLRIVKARSRSQPTSWWTIRPQFTATSSSRRLWHGGKRVSYSNQQGTDVPWCPAVSIAGVLSSSQPLEQPTH